MSDITPPTTLDKLEENFDTRFRDVFISYGRAESKTFASQLCERLTQKGYKVWFDQNDIPLGVDFQHQIDEGIETAHNFIFVIAPHAVKSPYCRKEIELAVKRGKRIIPILQIEPISREVWDMMHPAIGKINWIYMRQKWEKDKEQTEYETIDDFDAGFEGVLSLLEDEKEYTKKHTEILLKAIEWEKNQQNSMYLLVANERKKAEEWLFTRFETKQPPCLPSDLHARFISEAKKNANNLQTDVFIAFAEKENNNNIFTRDQIIYTLSLYGYTSWAHVNDLNSGVDFHQAIKKGVEGADNLVFLITRASLQSEYCMNELNYALSLNKRIIPLRLEEIDESEFPDALKNIQYIDFTDNRDNISLSKNEKTDFEKDIDDIISIIDTDQEYIQRHKILLSQALKWERQDKNSSMLLRGHNLEEAKVWLKIGQKRDTNIPLQIHEDFIKESQAKTSSDRTDVFISYSRTDGDMARRLNENLQIAGKTTWFDQESIASGADFQKEIYEGIQNADNIVFILSPEAISSPYCADEVEYAQKLGKRFITLLYREVNTEELPNALAAVQWIDFRANHTKFEKQFAEALRTLDTDRQHVQAHTKWQNEAMEWVAFEKNTDLLLRGDELVLANEWIEEAKEYQKIPAVTDLQDEFIEKSLKQQGKMSIITERNKQIAIAAISIIFSIAIFAGYQWYQSYEEGKKAAITKLAFEARNLVESSPDSALQLAHAAYKEQEIHSIAMTKNLSNIVDDTNIIPVDGSIFIEFKAAENISNIVATANNSRFLVITRGHLGLYNDKGKFIDYLNDGQEDYYYENEDFVDISKDGKYIVTYSKDGKINLFDSNGKQIREIKQIGTDKRVKVAFVMQSNQLFILVSQDERLEKSEIYEIKGDSVGYPYNKEQVLANIINNKSESILKYRGKKPKIEKGENESDHYVFGKYFFEREQKENSKQEEREDIWILSNNKDSSLIATYKFPKNISFSMINDSKIIVHNDRVAYMFIPPDKLKSTLDKKVAPLSSKDKIKHQIATLDDYTQVPIELSLIIAKIILFLGVFLLSIFALNYFNYLFLSQKYFKIILYSLVGFSVSIGWFFLVTGNYITEASFTFGLGLAIAGILFGIKNLKKKLFFNGILYTFFGVILSISSVLLLIYSTGGKSVFNFFTGLNLFLWIAVAIIWLLTEKIASEYSQRNFTYFVDWVMLLVLVMTFFVTLSFTDFSVTHKLSKVVFQCLFITIYFLRTLIYHFVLYRNKKASYSLSVLILLTPFIPIPVGIIALLQDKEFVLSFMIDNPIYRYLGIGLAIYYFIFYLYTIFVAFKQKDRVNLRANFLFWWSILVVILVGVGPRKLTSKTGLIYSLEVTISSLPTIPFETIRFFINTIKYSLFSNFALIIVIYLPPIWWAYKYFKERRIKKQQIVVSE